ncbi:MAG: class I SAM-dependent methyltransferase [Candidatus Aminicenantes bacterium]
MNRKKRFYWRGSKKNKRIYWEERGRRIRKYKGDWYYTITPLPYYVYRRERLLKEFAKLDFKGKRILEVGCGDGYYCGHLGHQHRELEVVGVDFSRKMLNLARKRLEEEEESSSLCQASGERLPFPEKSFDIVYIIAVLAHLEESQLQKCARETSRVIGKNGKLVLFERVSPRFCKEEISTRRPPQKYIRLFQQFGLNLETYKCISSPLYRWGYSFYHEIASLYHGLFKDGEWTSRLEFLIRRHYVEILVGLSRITDRIWQDGIGNGYFVFSK